MKLHVQLLQMGWFLLALSGLLLFSTHSFATANIELLCFGVASIGMTFLMLAAFSFIGSSSSKNVPITKGNGAVIAIIVIAFLTGAGLLFGVSYAFEEMLQKDSLDLIMVCLLAVSAFVLILSDYRTFSTRQGRPLAEFLSKLGEDHIKMGPFSTKVDDVGKILILTQK